MKHVNLSKNWSFGTNPFPAFRSSISREFVGVNGLTPDEGGVLVENTFKVVKIKEQTIMIVAGQDSTPRCLLFVGSSAGFRGDVKMFDEATTGKVIKTSSAGSALGGGIEIIAILDVDQSIAFHSWGRNTNQVEVHTWNGKEVESKVWTKKDWDRRNDPPRSEDNIKWIPGNFRLVQLHGNDVGNGVTLEGGQLTRYGDEESRMAHGFAVSTDEKVELQVARFGRDMHGELVIAPAEGGSVDTERCVVLVHEYSPGSGSKRWPSFRVDWDNAGPVEKLGSVNRYKGSGSDAYTLVIAPVGWAENIASQFVDERDRPGQTVAFIPGFKPAAKEIWQAEDGLGEPETITPPESVVQEVKTTTFKDEGKRWFRCACRSTERMSNDNNARYQAGEAVTLTCSAGCGLSGVVKK